MVLQRAAALRLIAFLWASLGCGHCFSSLVRSDRDRCARVFAVDLRAFYVLSLKCALRLGGEVEEKNKSKTKEASIGRMNALKVITRVCCLAVFFCCICMGQRGREAGEEQRCPQ